MKRTPEKKEKEPRDYKERARSRLMSMFLMKPAKLLLNIHALHLRHASCIFGRVWLTIVRQGRLLPTCLFLRRDVHARNAIVDVLALASKALEIVRNVGSIERRRVTSVELVALFLPARVQ
jgi:hypothetical protein